METCIACGKCCKKNWLVRLSSQREKDLFGDKVVFGEFIWTNECPYLIDNKCSIHDERQPFCCKEYFCEGNLE